MRKSKQELFYPHLRDTSSSEKHIILCSFSSPPANTLFRRSIPVTSLGSPVTWKTQCIRKKSLQGDGELRPQKHLKIGEEKRGRTRRSWRENSSQTTNEMREGEEKDHWLEGREVTDWWTPRQCKTGFSVCLLRRKCILLLSCPQPCRPLTTIHLPWCHILTVSSWSSFWHLYPVPSSSFSTSENTEASLLPPDEESAVEIEPVQGLRACGDQLFGSFRS